MDGALGIAVRIDRDRSDEARIIERHRSPTLAVALGVEGPVQRDPIDPSEEFASPFELRKLVVGLEKGVLRDVVRVACLARQMQR